MNRIPDSVKKYGDVKIGKGCFIGENCVIGYPYVDPKEPGKSFGNKEGVTTKIGNDCIIGSNVIICEGAKIGKKTHIEDFCRIGEYVIIGENCRILNGERIYGETKIGNNCKIGGYCCEGADIGNNVRHFGALIHAQKDPTLPWDTTCEPSPIIDDNVFIGFGAIIIGKVHIGPRVFILPGTIVRKNVPPKHIVVTGKPPIYYKNWKGELKKSPLFKDGKL